MSGLLSIGMNALNANSAALQTIGHNIANANTAGYTRQAVRLESALGHSGMGGVIGRGVHVVGVERVYSDFLSSQLNSTHDHQPASPQEPPHRQRAVMAARPPLGWILYMTYIHYIYPYIYAIYTYYNIPYIYAIYTPWEREGGGFLKHEKSQC
jgi:hypothetical protein